MLDRNLELFKSTFCVATRKKIDRPGLRRCSGAIEVRNVVQHAAVMLRESGASSTPRPFGFIADVSGILDRPLEPVIGRREAPTRGRAMTAVRTQLRDLAA
jgi:hypothetical protein